MTNVLMSIVFGRLIRGLWFRRSIAKHLAAEVEPRCRRDARRVLLARLASQPASGEPRTWQRQELYDRA